jgi:hypothetical protein
MYIYIETKYDELDDKDYVHLWKLLPYKKYDAAYPNNVHVFHITKVLSDFYSNSHYYYIDDVGMLRKNEYREFY